MAVKQYQRRQEVVAAVQWDGSEGALEGLRQLGLAAQRLPNGQVLVPQFPHGPRPVKQGYWFVRDHTQRIKTYTNTTFEKLYVEVGSRKESHGGSAEEVRDATKD